jgi:hypothetical protein
VGAKTLNIRIFSELVGGLIALHAGSPKMPTEENKPNPVAAALLMEVIESAVAPA